MPLKLPGFLGPGGIQAIEPQINLFLLAHRKCYFAEQQIAAVGENFVQATTWLEAIKILRQNALAKEEFYRLVGEKLRS